MAGWSVNEWVQRFIFHSRILFREKALAVLENFSTSFLTYSHM
jgi:hypothetical protein